MLNFIDLFSGAGGISCGLERAGHKCLLGVDYDKYAIETFNHNHRDAEGICIDLRELSNRRFKSLISKQKVNLIAGGPPCQGFSTVGTGNPNDKRNHLFSQFLRAVELFKPEYILIENVTGLLAKKNQKTLNAILKCFSDLGYVLNFNVLSSEEYGVPERRRRTIIIGSRINDIVWMPTKLRSKPKTVGDVIEKIYCRGGVALNHNIETAIPKNSLDLKRLKHIPEGRGIRYQADEKELLPKRLRFDVEWENLPEKRFRQAKYQRLDRSKPSPTIMTQRGNYYHPTEDRYLTAREAAKLQSFPNHYEFKGTLSAQWKQIGNAVPPTLAYYLGKHFTELSSVATYKRNRKKIVKEWETTIHKERENAFVYRNQA
ncbi:MAG: DNA cytosine methyltransferase [Bacteriovoracaceae bacterium]